ncbi:MAG: hypothetical protein V5A39_10550 [Haloarculaceae archaeon]
MDNRGSRDGATRLVRNGLAVLVSSALMVLVGFPVMTYEYDSGLAALGGTLALVAGLAVAVGVTFALLDSLERVATSLVSTWRNLRER